MGERPQRSEMHRKQRAKNWALVLALFAFVVVIYLITIVRMGGQ